MLVPSILGDSPFDSWNNWISPFDSEFFTRRNSPKHNLSIMKTDVKQLENAYEVDIDLPGFKKDDVSVSLENGYLTVSGTKSTDSSNSNEDNSFIRRERYYGSCSRSFYVGDGVTREDVSAKLEDGILKLTVPKTDGNHSEENKYISIEG